MRHALVPYENRKFKANSHLRKTPHRWKISLRINDGLVFNFKNIQSPPQVVSPHLSGMLLTGKLPSHANKTWFRNVGSLKSGGKFVRCFPEELSKDSFGYPSD